VISASELKDLIATTLNDLPKQEFEVGWTNQDYEACRIYQQDRMVIDGGVQIERKVMLSNTGNARYRKYHDTDDPQVGDNMKTITVPWTRLGTYYSWDDLEILHQMNSTKGFIQLMRERRIDGLWSLADLIEDRFWKTPTNADDKLYPYGIPYYINIADKDTTDDGWVGKTIRFQDGTTSNTCAGLSASTEEKWRNYAAMYTAINRDFMKKCRLMFLNTRFKAPIFVNDPGNKRNAMKRWYCDFDTVAELMDYVDAKDDSHTTKDAFGRMLVDDGEKLLLNRTPVVPIPQLEGVTDPETSDAYSPLYLVDFSYLIPVIHDGYWMNEGEPMTDRGQHTSFTTFLDGAHQNLCTNRRRVGGVMHKQVTA